VPTQVQFTSLCCWAGMALLLLSAAVHTQITPSADSHANSAAPTSNCAASSFNVGSCSSSYPLAFNFDSAVAPTYRSSASEVRVIFFATDENNRPIETVTRSDFAIVDSERVVRNFRSFSHSEETALDMVALVDLSESAAPSLGVAVADVLQLVRDEQAAGDDHLAILSFGGTPAGSLQPGSAALRPRVVCSSGCRASDSLARLRAAKSGAITPLFDALIFAADFMADHHRMGARSVLILFSDGIDTYSLHSANEALQAAQDAGILIYSVDMGASGRTSTGSRFLQQASDSTSGRYFPPRFSLNNGVASLLNTALADLRASYVVTYDLPSHEAGFHTLRLLPTHNLNLTFHSRNGYNYQPGGQ